MRLQRFESLLLVIAVLKGLEVVSAALAIDQTTIPDVLPSDPPLLRRFHAENHDSVITTRHLREVDATTRGSEKGSKQAANEEERLELPVTFLNLLSSIFPSIRVTPQMTQIKCDLVPLLLQIHLPSFIRNLIRVFGGSLCEFITNVAYQSSIPLANYTHRLNMETAQPEREPGGCPRFIASDPDPALEYRICPDCCSIQPNTRNLCECQDNLIWSTTIDELLLPRKDLDSENSIPILTRRSATEIRLTERQPEPDQRPLNHAWKVVLSAICAACIAHFLALLFNV